MSAELAERVVRELGERGLTLATAESLTGGLIAAAITDVPGASAVLRGGVVAYATDVKAAVLEVSAELLAREGAVHPDVAAQMAQGARRLLAVDIAVACTGVAGPDPQDGVAPGTAYVAVSASAELSADRVIRVDAPGGRAEVRRAIVEAALALVLQALQGTDATV